MTPKRTLVYTELNWFNAIACLLVMLIHILSMGITYLEQTDPLLTVIWFPYQLSAFVVPGFLVIGGVKLGLRLNQGPLPYLPYLIRREQKIYVPYLFWVVVYFAVYRLHGRIDGSHSLLFYILTGMVDGPFYYVIIVMQFYLLMPFWRWLVSHMPWYVSVPLSALVSLLVLKADNTFPGLTAAFPYLDRVFPTYLLFWVTGLYVGTHYEAVRSYLRHWKSNLWLAIGPLAFSLLSWRKFFIGGFPFDIRYLKLLTDCMAIFLLLSVCTALTEAPLPRLAAALSWIHESSFTVYLSHCLILNVGTALCRRVGLTALPILLVLRTLFTYSGAFLFYAVLSYCRKVFRKPAATGAKPR